MKVTPQREGEPLTKECPRCGEERWIVEFRLLVSGSRQGMCGDCEHDYDRDRKHSGRPIASSDEAA